jgi:hypothetical protein
MPHLDGSGVEALGLVVPIGDPSFPLNEEFPP